MYRASQLKDSTSEQQSAVPDGASEGGNPAVPAERDGSAVEAEQPIGSSGAAQQQEGQGTHEQPTPPDQAGSAVAGGTTSPDAPGSQAPEKSQKKDASASRAGKLVFGGPCVQCGATRSTLFRKCSDGRPLCNACGLRYTRSLQKHQHEPSPGEAPSAADLAASQLGDPSLSAASKKARRPHTDATPKTRRKLPPDELRRCQFCATTTSPQWRYCEKQLACNACALRKQRREDRTTRDAQDGATRKTERRSVDPEQREAEAEPEQAAPALPPAADAAVQPAISTQAPAAGAPIPKVPRTAAPSGGAVEPGIASSQALLACISYFASSLPSAAPRPAAGMELPIADAKPTLPSGQGATAQLSDLEGREGTGPASAAVAPVATLDGSGPAGRVVAAAHDVATGATAPPAEGDHPSAEQPPDGETVRGIVALLQSGGLVAPEEARAYITLWEQLDEFRQRAARYILVDAILWKHQPDGAVKHIRAVLADNS